MLGKIQQHQWTEEMIVLTIKAQAYLELHPTDASIKMSLLLTFILKTITMNTVCAPLLLSSLNYSDKKGLWSSNTITQNFTTNWFIKILIQTLKDDNMFGVLFQRVGRDQGSIPISSFSVCIYPVHYSNLKLITAL